MNGISLYNILQEHQNLLRILEETEGEVTSELELMLSENLANSQDAIASYGYMVKHFEDNSEVIDKEIKRLHALKKSAENKQERIKTILATAMQAYGIDKVEINNLKLSFRKSTAVEITDAGMIPDVFLVPQPPTINKKTIGEAIKEGKTVPGAMLVERKNLQIK